MAITINGGAFISRAVTRGVALGDLVTIGRQGLYAPKRALNESFARAGCSGRYILERGDPGYPEKGEWADEMYRCFGARKLSILDGSAYEGAGLIHDLNQKLPPELENKFDTLLDGGSLEHVFNVPEALNSYMKMVKKGGHIILLDMPATNLCGHGFYQFSPALFWQVFSRTHGFEVLEMLVAESVPFAAFWSVANPEQLKHRVELVHNKPCHLYVLARKVSDFQGLMPMPVQDDYSRAWSENASSVDRRDKKREWLDRAKVLVRDIFPWAYWKFTNKRNYVIALGDRTLGGRGSNNPYLRCSDDRAT